MGKSGCREVSIFFHTDSRAAAADSAVSARDQREGRGYHPMEYMLAMSASMM